MSVGLTINHFLWFQHISRSGMPSTNLYKVEVTLKFLCTLYCPSFVHVRVLSMFVCSNLSRYSYFRDAASFFA